ncbi:MAG: hypothetical protein AB1542_17950 [Pseudomonadota bacterium]|jgi:hypothetical protein
MTDDADPAAFGLRVVPPSQQDAGSSDLSAEEWRTLRQLERRTRSGHLEAVNIRHAQQLAKLGFARHGRGGWLPTREGLDHLEKHPGDASTAD